MRLTSHPRRATSRALPENPFCAPAAQHRPPLAPCSLMQLPPDLLDAIDLETRQIPTAHLAQSTRALSERYRAPSRLAGPLLLDAAGRCAYIAARLPATYAAIHSVFEALRRRAPDFRPATLLDLGAGPGAAAWAAAEVFTEIQSICHYEIDPSWIAAGRRMASAALHPALRSARWIEQDLRRLSPDASIVCAGANGDAGAARADIVILSYVLGEIEEPLRPGILRACWSAAKSALVIAEPGTQAGFQTILQARGELAAFDGARLLAPCPRAEQCPLAASDENDWCHFYQRIARTRRHRAAKCAELPFEDEKFSYLIAARDALGAAAAQGRILRPPVRAGNSIRFSVCDAPEIRQVEVRKSNPDQFRLARHLDWGDEWPFAELTKDQ